MRLVPPVQGGWAGWCTVTRRGGQRKGSSCPVDPTVKGSPIINESWSASSPPPTTEGEALTLGEVRSVSVNGGAPIATRAVKDIPEGLRSVVVEIDGERSLRQDPHSFTPLDARGQAIPNRGRPSPGFDMGARFWKHPEHPPAGVCAIEARGLKELQPQWGHVATAIKPVKGIVGEGFASCADTEYYLNKWPLDVGVLLDTSKPGSKPIELPNAKPIEGHQGMVASEGWNGAITAQRRGNAWLAVEGGSGQEQRIAALEHLEAVVSTGVRALHDR